MQVAGYISTPLEAKNVGGKSFHQFRLAVLSGRAETRRTTWFTVRAHLSELDADMLEKGQRVEVTGVLTLRPYTTREGAAAVESIIDTRQVHQAPPAERAPSPTGASAPVQSEPVSANQATAPTPAPASADVTTSVLRPPGTPAVIAVPEEDMLPF
jgi:single-stranded DNA-binding protein